MVLVILIRYVAQHSMGHIEEHLTKTPVEYLQWRFTGAVDREALNFQASHKYAILPAMKRAQGDSKSREP